MAILWNRTPPSSMLDLLTLPILDNGSVNVEKYLIQSNDISNSFRDDEYYDPTFGSECNSWEDPDDDDTHRIDYIMAAGKRNHKVEPCLFIEFQATVKVSVPLFR